MRPSGESTSTIGRSSENPIRKSPPRTFQPCGTSTLNACSKGSWKDVQTSAEPPGAAPSPLALPVEGAKSVAGTQPVQPATRSTETDTAMPENIFRQDC